MNRLVSVRSPPNIPLLLFVVFVIYKKNSSFSRVKFFFLSVQNCQLFFSKINDYGRLRATKFSSSRFGVGFTALLKFCTIYIVKPKTVTGSFTKFFGTVRQNFRRKIVIPLLCIKIFDTLTFLKP